MSNTPKVLVREREYDLNSWSGLKMIAKLIFIAVVTCGGILAVYYTCEAAQTKDIATLGGDINAANERHTAFKDESLRVFDKIDTTLDKQQQLISEARESAAEQRAESEGVSRKVDRLVESVESLGREVNQLGRRSGAGVDAGNNKRTEATDKRNDDPSM